MEIGRSCRQQSPGSRPLDAQGSGEQRRHNPVATAARKRSAEVDGTVSGVFTLFKLLMSTGTDGIIQLTIGIE